MAILALGLGLWAWSTSGGDRGRPRQTPATTVDLEPLAEGACPLLLEVQLDPEEWIDASGRLVLDYLDAGRLALGFGAGAHLSGGTTLEGAIAALLNARLDGTVIPLSPADEDVLAQAAAGWESCGP